MNTQPIEKRVVFGGTLAVHSIFKTIQGEGPFAGHKAIFVRLAGCNLQCPVCDTDYTSTVQNLTPKEIKDAVAFCSKEPTLVVITGGEPFRQDISWLVHTLLTFGYTVQIETNGTLAPPPGFNAMVSTDTNKVNMCFIVCSPKTGKVNKQLQPLICAYKYVMAHDSVADFDGLPLLALDHTAEPFVARPPTSFKGPIYLQPCDDKDNSINELNLQACVESVLEHGYILQLQIHKLIGVQ